MTKTRPIYEAAVQHVPDARIKDMCLKFAELELVRTLCPCASA